VNHRHFAYHPSQVPDTLDQLNSRLLGADAYVAVTPEYNHAPSPALLNMINHIGSSVMSYKPSLIVSYSQGQWGGARAAIGLRAPLSEMGARRRSSPSSTRVEASRIGCIPVSAMIHIPKAHEVLDESGVPSADPEQWTGYVDRGVACRAETNGLPSTRVEEPSSIARRPMLTFVDRWRSSSGGARRPRSTKRGWTRLRALRRWWSSPRSGTRRRVPDISV
jgi:hypothetical protein